MIHVFFWEFHVFILLFLLSLFAFSFSSKPLSVHLLTGVFLVGLLFVLICIVNGYIWLLFLVLCIISLCIIWLVMLLCHLGLSGSYIGGLSFQFLCYTYMLPWLFPLSVRFCFQMFDHILSFHLNHIFALFYLFLFFYILYIFAWCYFLIEWSEMLKSSVSFIYHKSVILFYD